jgi:hypothetical protein
MMIDHIASDKIGWTDLAYWALQRLDQIILKVS